MWSLGLCARITASRPAQFDGALKPLSAIQDAAATRKKVLPFTPCEQGRANTAGGLTRRSGKNGGC